MISICCRVGELSQARWEEINLEDGEWSIPAGNSKNAKEHTIFFSGFTKEQFQALHFVTGSSDWCVPSRDGNRHACLKSITRNTQFEYIDQKKQEFKEAGLPIISIDTKKKELIGNFKNAGRVWGEEAEQVNGHDFPSQSDGKAAPYGIYDVIRNSGIVCVGKSADTPEFSVDAIVYWRLNGLCNIVVNRSNPRLQSGCGHQHCAQEPT